MARPGVETTGDSRFGERRKGSRAGVFCIRLGVWLLATAVAAGAASLILSGLGYVLFRGNPHFVLQNIACTVTGRLNVADIEKTIQSELGIRLGQTNLFEISLRDVRELLEERAQTSMVIKRVEVVRQLPDTLQVIAYERLPVAQLGRPGGRLLDDEGRVLPERPESDLAALPVITGVSKMSSLQPGSTATDELLGAALQFLRLRARESYGRFLDVAIVKLDYSGPSLRAYLHARGTFVEGAELILPSDDLRGALARVEVIALDRQRGRQTTSFIDATYRVNIPVRP